jgi:hypothetical protein
MPSHRKSKRCFVAIGLMALLTLVTGTPAQNTVDPLEQGFKHPLCRVGLGAEPGARLSGDG